LPEGIWPGTEFEQGWDPKRRLFCELSGNEMFHDQVEINVKGGKGGQGCLSFRREKYVPRGGPDGGDGGKGGDVIICAKESLTSLSHLIGRKSFNAGNGRPGEGKKKTGRSGEDVVVEVPPGTLVKNRDFGNVLKDLKSPEDSVRVAKGGRGGRGNAVFATSENQAPRYTEEGKEGEERYLLLELKLMVDVGIIGLPNAGKSTLLSRVSRATPKIADYPFTTLEPNLGMVEIAPFQEIVMADIPGIIEGAHEGHGLGDKFLRHVERSRFLLHLIDLSPFSDLSLVEAYQTIRNELEEYSPELSGKPELVVGNKIDIPGYEENLEAFEKFFKKKICVISAVTGENLRPLLHLLRHSFQEDS